MKQLEKMVKGCLKRKISITKAFLVIFYITGSFSFGADTTVGAGNGVAYGNGSNAPKLENVAVGNNAKIGYSNGASAATGDIAVGNGANINNYASQGGSVAIGKNAKIENMAGGVEASFNFGQTTYSGSIFSSARIPADPTKVIGSVAIGDNTFARTGSTMIGSHNYRGALGDIDNIDTANTRTYSLNAYATTVGANSFSNGAFTTNTGSFSIISSDYNGGRFSNAVKNMGALINGSLNSIESSTAPSYYSGIANSVVGLANRTYNSNGSLIFGAGNEITNSVTSLSSFPSDSGNSAKEFAENLRTAIKSNEGGGSTLAIGGGNKADWTRSTAIIGINNEIRGASNNISTYNLINGYKNSITNSSKNIISGTNFEVKDTEGAVLLGFNDGKNEITKKNVVIIGNNAKATEEGAVALGTNSISDRALFTEETKAPYSEVDLNGQLLGAVSVGGNGKLRQITNVGDGTEDTDAVNLRQLKSAIEGAIGSGSMNYAGDNNLSDPKIQENETDLKIISGDLVENGEKYSGENITTNYKQENGNGTFTIAIKENPTFSDINANSLTIGDTKISRNEISIENGLSISNTGINMNNTKITNLKDGEISSTSTDAINGKQLYETNTRVEKLENASDEHLKAIIQNSEKIDNAKSEMRNIGALSSALAALHPMQYDPLQPNQMMAGVGSYRDKQAVAVGMTHYFNENLMMSAGVAVGNENRVKTMANLGITWKIGKDDDRKDLPERYKEGPIGSIYKMQEEMEKVLNENEILKSGMAAQNLKILEMQKQIEELLKRIQ